MMTVPGVGQIAALTIKAVVDDPTRLSRSRTAAAQFGLTLERYQSGEHGNLGRVSTSWRPGCSCDALCRSQCAADVHRGRICDQILGHGTDPDQSTLPYRRSRGQRIGCSGPPDVGR
ncbi:MAG: transposase [Cypionkella sp.]